MLIRQYLVLFLLTNLFLALNAVAINPTQQPAAEPTLPGTPMPDEIKEAIALMQSGRYHEALDLLDELEKAGHPPSSIYNIQGAIATQLRNFKRARIAFTKAVKAATNDEEREQASFNLAEIEFVEKKFPASYERFNKLLKTIKSAETKGLIQFKLFICEIQQGQKDAAQQRIKLMPPDSPQRDYSGVARACANGEIDAAQTQLDAAIKSHGEQSASIYCDALIEMGWCKDGKIILEKP